MAYYLTPINMSPVSHNEPLEVQCMVVCRDQPYNSHDDVSNTRYLLPASQIRQLWKTMLVSKLLKGKPDAALYTLHRHLNFCLQWHRCTDRLFPGTVSILFRKCKWPEMMIPGPDLDVLGVDNASKSPIPTPWRILKLHQWKTQQLWTLVKIKRCLLWKKTPGKHIGRG